MIRPPNSFLIYSTIGMELVLSILVGLFGGRWVDQKLHTGGALTLVGFTLGSVAGFLTLWRAAKRLERESAEETPDDPPPPPPPDDPPSIR